MDGYSSQGYPQDFGNLVYNQHYYQNYDPNISRSVPNLHAADPYASQSTAHISCDIKPRLTKEQHDILETHFQSQPKPNTSIKKGFADSLNVSLDKVNNWFQNRRAKSKQDAKKQNRGVHAVHAPDDEVYTFSTNVSSESESSPAGVSAEYYRAMHDGPAFNTVELPQQTYYHGADGLPISADAFMQPPCSYPAEQSSNAFDSPLEMNRRTMTQEQFDAMSYPQEMPHQQLLSEGFGVFGESNVEFDPFNVVYSAHTQLVEPKVQDDVFPFSEQVHPSLTRHNSSAPSTRSWIPAAVNFPSANTMQDHSRFPSSGSDWTADSRSSSLSFSSLEDHFAKPVPAPQQPQQSLPTSSRWQPGQSVPVDITQLAQEFGKAAHARKNSLQHHKNVEQPLAWPSDDMYSNPQSESQTRMITQSMSHVGIDTSQQQHAAFKSPMPAPSLASRRQRARPTPLGLASLRSQSSTDSSRPGSPSQLPQQQEQHQQQQHQQQQHQHRTSPGQTVRRIKSSTIMHNTVTGSRVSKLPGSAQRSPLNFTFEKALNSPKAMRHIHIPSSSTLAPPSPMSPREIPRPDSQPRHFSYRGEAHLVSSPPNTPLHPPQPQFARQRIGHTVITENTPPQSAPSAQTTFPSTFASAPAQPQPPSQPRPLPPQHAMQHTFSMHPEPPQRQPSFTLTTSPPQEHSFAFAPQSMPSAHEPAYHAHYLPPAPQQALSSAPSQPTTEQAYPFPISATSSPKSEVPKRVELTVLEYQPPEGVKMAAAAVVRKAEVGGAGAGAGGEKRAWTFSHLGAGDFEKKKVREGGGEVGME